MEKTIILRCHGIEVFLTGDGGGSISSDLKEECPYCSHIDCYFDCDQSQYDDELEDEDDTNGRRDYNSAINGIESMILAHAISGIDVTTPAYLEGIETAIQSCGSNL